MPPSAFYAVLVSDTPTAYETGFSALLLHLVGTLPVTFRGTTYRFPIALWIPNTYPREPPIAYVTPTQEMTILVGQHVTLEGQVYHHYLAHWAEAWDVSALLARHGSATDHYIHRDPLSPIFSIFFRIYLPKSHRSDTDNKCRDLSQKIPKYLRHYLPFHPVSDLRDQLKLCLLLQANTIVHPRPRRSQARLASIGSNNNNGAQLISVDLLHRYLHSHQKSKALVKPPYSHKGPARESFYTRITPLRAKIEVR